MPGGDPSLLTGLHPLISCLSSLTAFFFLSFSPLFHLLFPRPCGCIYIGKQQQQLCLKSWSDICKSRQEEGWEYETRLGIRNIQMVNKSLILNSAWRIVANPEEQVSQVLKGKYFPNTSFWNASINTAKSVFWSSILKLRKTLKKYVTWQLAEGKISIWSQPWCNLDGDIHGYIKLDLK